MSTGTFAVRLDVHEDIVQDVEVPNPSSYVVIDCNLP